jgi:thiol-disulfide isomerase/thioredoxin
MSRYVSFANELQGGGSGFMDTMKSTVANNKLTIVAIFAFIGLAVYLYFTYMAPKLAPSFKTNEEGKNSGGNTGGGKKTAEMFLFYVDWCPHCKTAKPEWNDLKAEYENKQINGYNVIFTEVNCTNESPEIEKMMDTYKIDGFPTIKLLKDGQVIEYDAKPTKETMEQFLNTVL